MNKPFEKMISWSLTPLKSRPSNVSWSEDASITIYNEKDVNGTITIIPTYVVVYVLYYDSTDKMTYLKDIRNDILYTIPSGAKSKGYTLAFKLNMKYKNPKSNETV